MEDLYKLCEEEFMTYDKQRKYLYTEETLQEVCLGIHSCLLYTSDVYKRQVIGKKIDKDGFVICGATFGLFQADETEFTADTAKAAKRLPEMAGALDFSTEIRQFPFLSCTFERNHI